MAELFDGMTEQMRWKEDPANLQSAQEKIDANNKRIAELKARLAELKQLKAENDMAARFLDVGDASMFNSIMSSRSSREMQKDANAADAENQRRRTIGEMQGKAEDLLLSLADIKTKLEGNISNSEADLLKARYSNIVKAIKRIEAEYPEVIVNYDETPSEKNSGKNLANFKEEYSGYNDDTWDDAKAADFLNRAKAAEGEEGYNEFVSQVKKRPTKEQRTASKKMRLAKAKNAIDEINDFAAADSQAEGALEADMIRREIKKGAKEFTWKGDRYIKTKSGWELAE